MRYGFYLPNFGWCGDVRLLADLAADAEAAGWDGVFLWDHLQLVEPAIDPWMALAAMALATTRIRLGPLVTPVPRRHIAKLAREVTTLDHLSGGRTVFGAGAGFADLPDYAAFGDGTDARERAARLDEGLDLLTRLWSGEPVSHHGRHFTAECPGFQPPVQRPRVPVWIAASWPARKPMERALRWDGIVPAGRQGLELTPDAIAGITAFVRSRREADRPFDIVRFGRTDDATDRNEVAACAEAGATWWIDYRYPWDSPVEQVRERLRQGPPRV